MRLKIGDFLKPVRNSIIVQPDVEYKQVTIRMNNQGVCLRGIKKGIDIKTKRQFLVEPEQFILSKIDARNGAFGLVPEDLAGAIVTQDFPTYSINHQIIDKDYLVLLSSSKFFVDLMKKSSSGTTNRKRLKEERFLNIEIELPTLPEQQNKIQRYNLIHSITKNIQEKNNLVFKQSRKLLEKVLDENTFKDSSIKAIPLKELTVKIGSGSTPKGGRNVYKEDGIPFIRSQNVLNDRLDLTNIAYIDEKTHERMKGTKVYPGDILLNITGGSIGRSCVVPDTVIEANVSQHVMIIRLKDNDYSNFIHNVFLSPTFQMMIMDVQVGISREGLSKKKLENFYIPVPNKTDLNSIEKKLVSMIDKTTALTEKIQSNLRIINQIEKTVIAE